MKFPIESKQKVAEKITKELSKEGKKVLIITLTKKDNKLSLSVRGNRKQIYQRTKKFGKIFFKLFQILFIAFFSDRL